MRNLTILSLLFAIVSLSSARFAADVPLAIWSGAGYLTGQNIAVTNTLTPNEVGNLLDSFLSSSEKTGVLSQYASPKSIPEVIVIFAEHKIRSDQVSTHKKSFTNLKNYLQTEESSLFAPFVDLAVSFCSFVVNMAYTTQVQTGQVFYVGKGSILLHDLSRRVPSTTILTLEKFDKIFSKSTIFSDGVTDIIIVYLDSKSPSLDIKFKESDDTIKSVQSLVSSKTSKYVSAYIGLECDELQLTTKFAVSEPQYVHHSKRFNLQSNNYSNNTNGTIPIFRQYFGGWFWELFLVCIILIPLLIVGVFGINGIQTPLFEDVKKKGKMITK